MRIKRLISGIAMLCMVMLVSAADFNPQQIAAVSRNVEPAWNGNEFVLSDYTQTGNDVTYVIYDNDLKEQKVFTLYNIIKTETRYDDDGPYEVEVQGPSELECDGLIRTPIFALRNVFSSDGKWCVLIYNRNLNNALAVYNEEGVKLGEIPCYSRMDSGFWFSAIHDTKPVYFTPIDGQMTFWSFTGSNGAFAPTVRTSLSGYPNPLPKGESFIVELPEPSDRHTVIAVTDMNGRQVYRSEIAPGNESATFTLRNEIDGILIYTVIYGDGKSVSGRLIAK